MTWRDPAVARSLSGKVGRTLWRHLSEEYRRALYVDDLTDEWITHVIACALAGPCVRCGRSVDVSGHPESRVCGACLQDLVELPELEMVDLTEGTLR